MIASADFEKQIALLLEKSKLSTTIISIKPCQIGGNNRTYRVETPDGRFALKKYFRQNDDVRDRLAAEFIFLSYAKKAAPQFVPAPYFQDSEAGIAFYEFIDGQPFSKNDISDKEVDQAIQFFCLINEAEVKKNAVGLPLASEACFSIQDHLNLVTGRIHTLEQMVPQTPEDNAAKKLIQKMSSQWQLLLNRVNLAANTMRIDIADKLNEAERCVSPSDFGFHNALKMADGTLRFLDFEYAGWDDPAKMVGDFFSQLAVPVSPVYFDYFAQAVLKPFSESEHLLGRAKLLRWVYQLKWCCIAMNIFIPVHLARRQFANPNINVVEFKRIQLLKAESLLQAMELFHHD